MLRSFYDWTLRSAGHRHAERWLALVAFVESSVFPIPPDVMIIPMVLADRTKAWRIALIATLASVAGGMLGYTIGAVFFEQIGQPILELYGYGEKFKSFAARYNEWGAWIVFGAGVTPFPYKVITIASGVTRLDILVFLAASGLARGVRFFIVAGLLWWFGPPIRRLLEKHLGLITVVFFVLLVGGFLVLKWLL
ncbi:MAG: DedA family protein [Alphaproteobacteria bacterium]|nr:DedA family protein [Alphaproteobacteria bacterium]